MSSTVGKYSLLSSFHLNGHTLRFHPQAQTLEPPYVTKKWYYGKALLIRFHLTGHALGFHSQTQNVEPACIQQ